MLKRPMLVCGGQISLLEAFKTNMDEITKKQGNFGAIRHQTLGLGNSRRYL